MSLRLTLVSPLPGVYVHGMCICIMLCRYMENTSPESNMVCPDAIGNPASSVELREPGRGSLVSCLFPKPPGAPQRGEKGCQAISTLAPGNSIWQEVRSCTPSCNGTSQLGSLESPAKVDSMHCGVSLLLREEHFTSQPSWSFNSSTHIRILAAVQRSTYKR